MARVSAPAPAPSTSATCRVATSRVGVSLMTRMMAQSRRPPEVGVIVRAAHRRRRGAGSVARHEVVALRGLA